MGRHKAMTARDATPVPETRAPAPVARSMIRRVDPATFTSAEKDRYRQLRRVRIRVPDSPLCVEAVDAAARVWARTEPRAETTSVRATRILARYL